MKIVHGFPRKSTKLGHVGFGQVVQLIDSSTARLDPEFYMKVNPLPAPPPTPMPAGFQAPSRTTSERWPDALLVHIGSGNLTQRHGSQKCVVIPNAALSFEDDEE